MATNATFDRILRGAILRQLRTANVYDQIVSRDLVRGNFEEPEDTVRVQTLGDVSISTYNGTLPTPEDITTDEDVIEASHKRAFAFKSPVDDSASAIADQFAAEGVASLRQEAQRFVLGQFTDADLQVTYDPSTDSIREKVAEAAVKMDNAEAPDGAENRWLVLPPSVVNDISDDVVEKLDTGLAEEMTRSRFYGTFKGFRIYKAPAGQFTNTGTSPAYDHALAGINHRILINREWVRNHPCPSRCNRTHHPE